MGGVGGGKLQIMNTKFGKYKVVWNANLKRVNIFLSIHPIFFILSMISFFFLILVPETRRNSLDDGCK